MEAPRYLEIFIADDSYAHIRLFQLILNELGIRYRLSTAADGEKAVDFFLKRGDYAAAPDPDIVFLDLYMPRLRWRASLKKNLLSALVPARPWLSTARRVGPRQSNTVSVRFPVVPGPGYDDVEGLRGLRVAFPCAGRRGTATRAAAAPAANAMNARHTIVFVLANTDRSCRAGILSLIGIRLSPTRPVRWRIAMVLFGRRSARE